MDDRTPSERHLLRLERRTRARRWRHKPSVTLSDVAVWIFFTLLTAAVLLAGCILLTLIWPTPADAHVKTWHRVATLSGSDGDKYGKAFRLRGGNAKLFYTVTGNDPDDPELALFAGYVVRKGLWNVVGEVWPLVMGGVGRGTIRLHPMKGSYRMVGSALWCDWTMTVWEKR